VSDPDTVRDRGRDPGRDRGPERGAGLIGVIAGVAVFLAFLLFAVQLLMNLYATSAVTSAAFDGARAVAGHRVAHRDGVTMHQAEVDAEARIRTELGRFGDQVTIDWSSSDDNTVAVRVQGRAPRFRLPGLGGPLGFDQIDRTARVRREDIR
jgi:hypothetical protein